MTHLVAIDQGTTSTRAIVFDASLAPVATAQQELRQIYPRPGWVEHDPEDIWSAVVATVREAMAKAGLGAKDVAGIGITNQRETTIVWDRVNGKPIHNAIVWQDRRTAEACAALQAAGPRQLVRGENRPGARSVFLRDQDRLAARQCRRRARAQPSRANSPSARSTRTCCGGSPAARSTPPTRPTQRARCCSIFPAANGTGICCGCSGFPRALLPEVRDCASDFGETLPDLFGGPIKIRGIAGDQQAATIGQGCFKPGMMKSTYGTGCFALLNTGPEPVHSRHRLLTTIAYSLGGQRTYALEGAIFIAGAAVQWLRDGLHFIKQAPEVNALAAKADPAEQVYLVPAFVGLGAPYWDADARGAIFGLTRNSGAAEIARAALEAVGYQTRDLLEAMKADWPAAAGTVLRVDGGMTASDITMQFLADILASPVDRPVVMETTALGAAYLAGYQAGVCPDPAGFSATWKLDRRFEPAMDETVRARKWAGWQNAIARVRTSG